MRRKLEALNEREKEYAQASQPSDDDDKIKKLMELIASEVEGAAISQPVQDTPKDKTTNLNTDVASTEAPLFRTKPILTGKQSSNHWTRSNEIRALVEEFQIPRLVHFTRCENLESIARHGLHSVATGNALGLSMLRNDTLRLDKQLDGISLSIGFPNYRMFYKYRRQEASTEWAVLSLSPEILWEKQCGFYQHNAADSRMRYRRRQEARLPKSFRDMFDAQNAHRDERLYSYDPTDAQAEVLVYEPIEPHFIQEITFETEAIESRWRRKCGGVKTNIAERNTGLFSSRDRARERNHTVGKKNKAVLELIREPLMFTAPSEDQQLFSALRLKTTELAAARGVPAHAVFHDRVLYQIARDRPQNMDQFMRIEGIGEKKAKRYGDLFLSIIAEHQKKVAPDDPDAIF